MPKQGPGKGKSDKTRECGIRDNSKVSQVPHPGTSHRPRTRAWAKQEAEREEKRQAIELSKSRSKGQGQLPRRVNRGEPVQSELQQQKSNSGKTQPAGEKVGGRVAPSSNQDQILPVAKTNNRKSRKAVAPTNLDSVTQQKRLAKPEKVATRLSETSQPRKDKASLNRNQSLTAWIAQVETVSPKSLRQTEPPNLEPSGSLIDESESGTMPPPSARDESTPVPKSQSGKNNAPKWYKLARRGIREEPFPDAKTHEMRRSIESEPVLNLQDIEKLQTLLNKLFRQSKTINTPGESCNQLIENLLDGLSSWSTGANFPTISKKHFINDVERCKRASEHMLQRTLMIAIVDRHQLNHSLDLDCESKWNRGPGIPIMKTKFEPEFSGLSLDLPAPQPDLAFFFTLKSFVDTQALIPAMAAVDLNDFLHPDGSKIRCFPFFFLEMKAAEKELKPAHTTNLYIASQALLNIYKWMKKANLTKMFFDEVRVFSLALNVDKFCIRIHRAHAASQGTDVEIIYTFDVVCEEPVGYRKDYVCALVRNILHEYGVKELLPILQKAYNTVTIVSPAPTDPDPQSEDELVRDSADHNSTIYENATEMEDQNGNQTQDAEEEDAEVGAEGTDEPQPKRKPRATRSSHRSKKPRTAKEPEGQPPGLRDSFIDNIGAMST